jgi:hypothetical protein
MPKETTVLQIFVGSPTDVNDERELLDKVVAELNRTLSNNIGVTLELLKSETHVHPSSSTYPQAVVNEQIGQEYDVFIGIFWGKIGTPTLRAISGSVEEFELAHSRRIANNNKSPELMIYFKDAPIEYSKKDEKQFSAVQEFKSSMSEKGVFYSQFGDKFSFESSVRSHLSAVAQKFAIKHEKFIPAYIKTNSKINIDESELEQSDYLEIHIARSKRVTNAYHAIIDASDVFTAQVNAQTKKIINIKIYNPSVVKIIYSEIAKALLSYSETLKNQILLAGSSRKVGLNALSRALSFADDSEEYNIKLLAMKKLLNEAMDANRKTQSSISKMKLEIQSMSDKQLDFYNAKESAVIQAELLIEELKSSNFSLINIISSIDQISNR